MSELARVETRRVGQTQLVAITGEVDLSNARACSTGCAGHAVPTTPRSSSLDLSATTYLDSAGIAALFRLAQRLRIRRQDLRLVVPPTTRPSAPCWS